MQCIISIYLTSISNINMLYIYIYNIYEYYVFMYALPEKIETFSERYWLGKNSLRVGPSWIYSNCKSVLFLWCILLSLFHKSLAKQLVFSECCYSFLPWTPWRNYFRQSLVFFAGAFRSVKVTFLWYRFCLWIKKLDCFLYPPLTSCPQLYSTINYAFKNTRSDKN